MDEQFESEFKRLVSELNYICPSCYGHGRLFLQEWISGKRKRKKCDECHGSGRVEVSTVATIFNIGVEKWRELRLLWAAANGLTLIERDSVERSGGKEG